MMVFKMKDKATGVFLTNNVAQKISNKQIFQVFSFLWLKLTFRVSVSATNMSFSLGCPPSQDASGKWRFRLGSPTKNMISWESKGTPPNAHPPKK